MSRFCEIIPNQPKNGNFELFLNYKMKENVLGSTHLIKQKIFKVFLHLSFSKPLSCSLQFDQVFGSGDHCA